jgi:serine/threonine protein kinase
VIKTFDVTDGLGSYDQFINELKIMKTIKRSKYKCFTELVDYGQCYSVYSQGIFQKSERFIVMKKLGISLYTILNGSYQNLRKVDVLKAGLQMINCVEKYHSLGYVHLDIKVNNILFRPGDKAYNYNSTRSYNGLVDKENQEHLDRLEYYHKNRYNGCV